MGRKLRANHFYALVQAIHMNCSDFMASFKAELARRFNKLYRREGTLGAGRFKAGPVIGDEAMVEQMRYHPVQPGGRRPCSDAGRLVRE